ncbi:MAG: TSUP family transporter [bacterium]
MSAEYAVLILLGFFTSVTSAVVGFGSAMLVLAIGPYFLPVREVIALSAVLFTASTLTKSVLFAKFVDWKLAGIMSTISFPFAYFGASIVSKTPIVVLERLLGGMILLYIALNYSGLLRPWKLGAKSVFLGSAGYGFISGLLGSGNLVKAIVFKEMKLSKESFVGAMAATSIFANLAKLTAYNQAGLLHSNLALPMVGLAVAAVLAVFTGRYLLRRVSTGQFGAGVQIILALSAIGLII